MARNSQKAGSRSAEREGGAVALEFVILFPLLMLILVGILEFGHLFYVRHTLTNATREGARAASMYYVGPNKTAAERITWTENKATDAVDNYLGLKSGQTQKLPGVTFQTPVPAVQVLSYGSSAAGETGSAVQVTVTATDVSLVLGTLVSAFKNEKVSAQTTMRLE